MNMKPARCLSWHAEHDCGAGGHEDEV